MSVLFLLDHRIDYTRLLGDLLLSHNSDLRVRQFAVNFFARHVVHVFHMSAKVSALSEGLITLGALERSHSGMLSKVVTQVATLLKDTVTTFVLTFEE